MVINSSSHVMYVHSRDHPLHPTIGMEFPEPEFDPLGAEPLAEIRWAQKEKTTHQRLSFLRLTQRPLCCFQLSSEISHGIILIPKQLHCSLFPLIEEQHICSELGESPNGSQVGGIHIQEGMNLFL